MVLLALALTIPLHATAAPYAVLAAVLAAFRDAAAAMPGLRYTSVAVIARSTRAGVPGESSVLPARAGNGTKTIRVDAAGVLDIPRDAALASESPEITINQPKGTVNIRLQPSVRPQLSDAATLDLVAGLAAEYRKVMAEVPLLARTYTALPVGVRVVSRPGASIRVRTGRGVVFLSMPGGAQALMADFPKGCRLSVDGGAERIELVFGA